MRLRPVNPLNRFLEILLIGLVNMTKCLRVSVDQREPRTLDLNHHTMTFEKTMHGSGFSKLFLNFPRMTSPRIIS